MHSTTPYIVEDTYAVAHGRHTRVTATIELDVPDSPVALDQLPRVIGWTLYGMPIEVDGDLPNQDIPVENGAATFTICRVQVNEVNQSWVKAGDVS